MHSQALRALWLALAVLVTLPWAGTPPAPAAANPTLLNVSYDPTRELYHDINAAFIAQWRQTTGESLRITQSHGGSGKQARSVQDGLAADVVTLALGFDIDAIAARGLIATNWQSRLPFRSTPYRSVIVLLVRKGNPKAIRDWPDLAKPGVEVISPNPKTSGGARWNYLAAYGYALRRPGGNDIKARNLVGAIFRNVKVLDAGARASMTTFAQRGIGDVLIGWENEMYLAKAELGRDDFEIIYPSETILAEPAVAVVDRVVDRKGTRKAAEAYLQFLFSAEGQAIGARHYFRTVVPVPGVKPMPEVPTFTVDDMFSGWNKAHADHFADGAQFDQIFRRR